MEMSSPEFLLSAKLNTGFLTLSLPCGEKVKFPVDYEDKDVAWLTECIKEEDSDVHTVKFADSDKARYCKKTRLYQIFSSSVSVQINDLTSPVVYQESCPVSMAKVANNSTAQAEPSIKRSRPSDGRMRASGDGRSDGRGEAAPSTSGLKSVSQSQDLVRVCHAMHVDNRGIELKVENTLFYVRYSESVGEFSERLADDVGPVNLYRESDGASFSKRNTIGEVLLHYSVRLKLMRTNREMRISCDDILEGLQNWMISERGASSSNGATNSSTLRSDKIPSFEDAYHKPATKDGDRDFNYSLEFDYPTQDLSGLGGAPSTSKRGNEHLDMTEGRDAERKYARGEELFSYESASSVIFQPSHLKEAIHDIEKPEPQIKMTSKSRRAPRARSADSIQNVLAMYDSLHDLLSTGTCPNLTSALLRTSINRKTITRYRYIYYLRSINPLKFAECVQNFRQAPLGGMLSLDKICKEQVDIIRVKELVERRVISWFGRAKDGEIPQSNSRVKEDVGEIISVEKDSSGPSGCHRLPPVQSESIDKSPEQVSDTDNSPIMVINYQLENNEEY